MRSVTTDESFSVPSPANKKCSETALALIGWYDCPHNHANLSKFSLGLCVQLHACFSRRHTSLRLRKEKMWRAYHHLRTSASFCKDWEMFLHNSVSHRAHPAFFQHVSHHIFKELMKTEFPLPPPDAVEHPDRLLTFEEENALRFVAGYICRKVHTKLEMSTFPEREEMMQCIISFVGDEAVKEEETELWVNTIDRGGLWHVNDITYTFFVIVEITRQYFNTKSILENSKPQMMEHIMHHDDVLFQWCFLTTSVQEKVGLLLLERLIQLYVTVRGFGFATSCVEMYKQHTKQSLQRKKALRKHIAT